MKHEVRPRIVPTDIGMKFHSPSNGTFIKDERRNAELEGKQRIQEVQTRFVELKSRLRLRTNQPNDWVFQKENRAVSHPDAIEKHLEDGKKCDK